MPKTTWLRAAASAIALTSLTACGSPIDETAGDASGSDASIISDAAATVSDAGLDTEDANTALPDATLAARDASTEATDAGLAPADASTSPADAAAPVLSELTPSELNAALQDKDFVMIDVHIPYAGVIAGTDASISYKDVDALVAFIGVDLDREIVLTCLGDGMSRSAGGALVQRGYRAVSHLEGGMNAWVNAGFSLEP